MSSQNSVNPATIDPAFTSASITSPGGSGVNHTVGGKLGASIGSQSLDSTMLGRGASIDGVISTPGALSENPFNSADALAPAQNIGKSTSELQSNAQGIAPQIKSFGPAIGSDIIGKTGPMSLNTNQSQQKV